MANQAYAYPRVSVSWQLPPGPDAKLVRFNYRSDGTFTIAVNDLDIVAEMDFHDACNLMRWLENQTQYERDARLEEHLRNRPAVAKSS